ncbi:MAG: ABC transporter substrate-binding protein [Limisphaerales bacterium]
MMPILKRVLLSLVLLSAGASILLLSDLHSREGARNHQGENASGIRVALLKHSSNSLLDEVERGVVEQLAAAGYRDHERLALQRFCAEGDLPTANAIAQRMTDGSFKMAISVSTLSLQCVANANKNGRAIHVFGGVTDPAGAGVGIREMGSTNKPPWIAGIGTFQPVDQILREAKRLWPGLKVVGVVWNPTERNSETCTLKAREVCHALGLQLLEANVDQSKDVREAADSLIARGVEAFWTGADVTVNSAAASLCEAALKARIPVFSNTSGQVREGTLFDLGANYDEVGRCVGAIAAAILDGANPASFVITNFMPQRIMLNKQVLKKMRDPWRFTDDITARADSIIGEDGRVEKEAGQSNSSAAPAMPTTQTQPPPAPRHPLAKRWQIQETSYLESVMVEDAMRGFRDGLKEEGLDEAADFTLRTLSAQGDMAALGTLFDSAKTAGVDLYLVYGTPTLQAAIRQVRGAPVLFTVVADPFVAGAGKSDEDHLPNLTGVYTQGPYREMAELLRTHFPEIRRVGTLFCPAEVNSVANKDLFVREATRCGLTVETVPANSASELSDAALALCGRRLDAVVQVIDNLSAAGFPAIARAAAQARLPVFSCQSAAAKQGAAVVLARDYYDAGRQTAALAARVMRGESPAHIPFSPPTRMQKLVNLKKAQDSRLAIPAALLRESRQVTDPSQR